MIKRRLQVVASSFVVATVVGDVDGGTGTGHGWENEQ